MSPERAGIQKYTLLFQISNINIFCSIVHPHLIQVYYSTWQTLVFQETTLKQMCWGSCLALLNLLWNNTEYMHTA